MAHKNSIRKRLQRYRKKQDLQIGMLGNYSYEVEVPGRPNFVYVRLAGQVVSQVYNDRVNPLLDLEVYVGYDDEEPGLLQVLGVRSDLRRYGTDDDTSAYVPEHHKTHEWMNYPSGGNDVVFSELRQLMPLRPTPMPTGVALAVNRGIILSSVKEVLYFTGSIIDLGSYIPSTGSRFAYVGIDSFTGLLTVTGGLVRDTLSLTFSDIPDFIVGTYPIGVVRLYENQTKVEETYSSTDLIDLRFPFLPGFLNLYDAPSSYAGHGSKAVFVNSSETGLEFLDVNAAGADGNTGIFINPMTTLGDMIYSDFGYVAGRNVAVYSLGARVSGSSYVPDATFSFLPYYLLRSDENIDHWRNLYWASEDGLGYSFDTTYAIIDLGATYTIVGWSLRSPPISSDYEIVGQYSIATAPTYTGSWTTVVANHAAPDSSIFEYAEFATPQTSRYFKFQGIQSRSGLIAGMGWNIENISLYELTLGQKPTRLPIGTNGQILTSRNITGALVPDWETLTGDLTGSVGNVNVWGILGHYILTDPGHPANGDHLEFFSGVNAWKLVTGSTTGGGADITKWYSPLTYGATGDGIVDDTNSVLAAIADMPAEGGVLYFPGGYKFKTGGGFKLDKPITVKGMGNSSNFDAHYGLSTVICTSGSAVLFEVNSYGCNFEDIFLMGVTGTTPTAGAGISVVNGGDYVSFKNVTAHSFYIDVDIQDGFAWHMDHCVFVNPVKYGLKVQHVGFVDGGDQFVSNCLFWADGRTSDAAIRYESGGGLKISNTKIVGSGQSDKQFHYGIDAVIDNNVITVILLVDNTSIENIDTNAIRVISSATGSSQFEAVILHDLEIAMNDKGSASSAIYVAAQTPGVMNDVIIDNVIAYDWQGTITDPAVYLDGVNHVRIGSLIVRDGFGGNYAVPNCTDVSTTIATVTVTEQDGNPTVPNVSTFKFANGSVVDNGDGSVSVNNLGEISIGGTGTVAAQAYHNANQTLSNFVFTPLSFNSEYYDTSGDMHINTGSTNTRLVAPSSGYYRLGATVKWEANTTGIRELYIYKNSITGTAIGGSSRSAQSGGTTNQSVEAEAHFTQGEYAEVFGIQNSGGDLDVLYAGNYASNFWMHRISTPAENTGSSQSFTGLVDTPDFYTGSAGKVLAVNQTETAIEFRNITGTFALTIQEADGLPNVYGVTTIKVSNGTLVDDGGGVVTIQTGIPTGSSTSMPGVKAYLITPQSVNNAAAYRPTFEAEYYDTADMHTITGSTTGRLTAMSDGYYSVGTLFRFAANASGVREVYIYKNGVTGSVFGGNSRPAQSGGTTMLNAISEDYFNAGDFVDFEVWQTSGGPLNLSSGSSVWMRKVSI